MHHTGAQEGTRFIVMEYVSGHSLATVLQDRDPLDPTRAASIAERVADGLAAADDAGLIHRDVKPGNVMLAADGSVKVLDFGIARGSGQHHTHPRGDRAGQRRLHGTRAGARRARRRAL